jgi:RNA polymerase sigma-70 factor (ECF subfamily)
MLGEEFDDVLEAARSGGEWAWSRVYKDLAGQLVGYLRMSGAHEPEDLVGEVFVLVARNLHRFRGNEDNFRSWVFGVAHHRLIDERRYRSRRPVEPTDTLPEPALPDIAHAVMERLATEAVGRLLGDLTEDQRDVLLLRIVGGLTIDEIGEVLNKRPGAVKSLQRRGLRSLRTRIGEKAVPL